MSPPLGRQTSGEPAETPLESAEAKLARSEQKVKELRARLRVLQERKRDRGATIANETPRTLILPINGTSVAISPLAEHELDAGDTPSGLETWESLGAVSIHGPAPDDQTFKIAVGATVLLLPICLVGALVLQALGFGSYSAAPLLVVAIPFVVAALNWEGAMAALLGASQGAMLVANLLIAILVPLNFALFTVSPSALAMSTAEVAGCIVQIVFIAGVSSLPAFLFFAFDRRQLSNVRDTTVRCIFRMDPHIRTRSDLLAKYGGQLHELYGDLRAGAGAKVAGGARLRVGVATLACAVGWVLVLPSAAELISPVRTQVDILSFLVPVRSSVAFAFLGAYAFTLTSVAHGHLRGDLHEKRYAHAVVRLVLAIIAAWVLDTLPAPDEYASAIAFTIGAFPEIWLAYIQTAAARAAGFVVPNQSPKHGLEELDGPDIHDRIRLQEEGVTTIESLAHHDVVELALRTRIPPAKLMDWVDQAILFLHAHGEEGLLQHLKSHGVRTATDLRRITDEAEIRKETDAVLAKLDRSQPDDTSPSQTRMILDALRDDEWFEYAWHWREYEGQSSKPIRAPEELFAAPCH